MAIEHADMMESGDIAVVETAIARHTGSTPVIGTFFLLVQRIEFLATNQAMGVRVAQGKLIATRQIYGQFPYNGDP